MDRTLRRALEERAKQIRLRGQLEGWSRDRVVDEILGQVPGISPLEAHRFAAGWTRQQLSRALDALYEADGLMPPQVSVSEICRWEHGRHQPNAERQLYLTRLYRTRPDRLGFGRDYSPREPEAIDAGLSRGGLPDEGSNVAPASSIPASERPVGISAGTGDRIVSVRWVPDEKGGADLVVEVEDGDRDGRAVLRLAGWCTPGERASHRAGPRAP
jgi:transcriptional regulator with XRE-family HTH domain